MVNLEFIQSVLPYAVALYIISTTLYAYRAIRGPSISDSVLAIDSIAYNVAALFLVFALYIRQPILVATAIVLALWVYALDIYISKYLEGKHMGE